MSTRPLAQQVVPGADGAESSTAEDGAVRPRDSLFHWCGTVDAICHSTDQMEKVSLLEAYFGSVAEQTIAPAARFFAGRIFPPHEARSIDVGWSLVVDTIQDLSRIGAAEFRARYERHGDLGDVAAEAFAGRLPSGIAVVDIETWADELADASDAGRQRVLLREMLARLSSLEAKYLVKLVGGEFRVGLEEADIEEALARRVRRARR
jgi:DNA ligase-1